MAPEALDMLTQIVGRDNIVTDRGEIEYFSQDYFNTGMDTLAVVRPETVEALALVVGRSTAKGLAVFPRGGGYSYTDGYLPTQKGITLDLRQLDRIVEINAHDMYVTVEAGCTWAKLEAALKPLGLRTAFWGPFSGLRATVGGSISQGSISWGSSKYGVSSETVLDLEVVLADGTLMRTGTSGQPGHRPFFRNYGPDLTGLFCSDCGALGVKARITLKLIARPGHFMGLSFGFPTIEAGLEAAARVARLGVVADTVGVLSLQAEAAAAETSLTADLKALWKIGQTGSSGFDRVKRMGKVALAGRRFLKASPFMFHFIVEGLNETIVAGEAEAVRAAVGDAGNEIANTVPTMLRADPFLNYDMLNTAGQRQLPPSTILPLSEVIGFHHAFEAAIAPLKPEMAASAMSVFPVFATVGTTGFLYEPVIAWNDEVSVFQKRHSADAVVAKADGWAADPAARALAARIRQIMIDLAFARGGVHLQIGKVYPYLRERDAAAAAMLGGLKRQVDPQRLLNPGALGL
jgi:FAD/FMN-containing dehydrogenase